MDDFKKAENVSEFLAKYPMFEMFWAELKEAEQDGGEVSNDELVCSIFLGFAAEKNVMFRVDWSGEEKSGDVAEFVK